MKPKKTKIRKPRPGGGWYTPRSLPVYASKEERKRIRERNRIAKLRHTLGTSLEDYIDWRKDQVLGREGQAVVIACITLRALLLEEG